MPDNWNPQVYLERAQRWRETAGAHEPGAVRDALVSIAEGYERLATLIERDQSPEAPLPST